MPWQPVLMSDYEISVSVMMVPVNEVPPVPLEIQQDVEKFREKFLESDAT